MSFHRRPADYGRCVVWWEIPKVILQLEQIEGGDLAVGRIPGYDVHRSVSQRAVHESWLHARRRSVELEPVPFQEPRVAILSPEELVTETSAPFGGVGYRLGHFRQVVTSRGLAADQHGKRVLEPERSRPQQLPSLGVH
jgi:hypothetical protein